MPDSSAIDNALLALLGSDSALLTLMPNGVHWEEAPTGSTRFVIVSLIDHVDEPMFGGRAYEDALYLVKAVTRIATADIRGAAARIDELLDDQVLTVPGYTHMGMYREARIRTTEVDESDTSIRWQHRGGHYRVQQAPV